MNGKYLSNNDLEVYELANGDCYFKRKGKYYFKPKLFASEKYYFEEKIQISWSLFDSLCSMFIVTSIVTLIFLIRYSSSFFRITYPTNEMILFSLIFLLINIVTHEMSHAAFLKIWNRKVGKIGINFRFIFPMITVDTSDSYLLPKFRRFCVYYAGVMINIFWCGLIWLFFPKLTFVIPQILMLILFCLFPLGGVRNDGYHILYSILLGRNNFQNKKTIFDTVGKVVLYGIVFYSIFNLLFR